MTVRTLLCPACPGNEGFTSDRACNACGADAYNAPDSEAWHVEQAIDSVIATESLRSICADWVTKGVLSTGRRRKQPDGTRGEIERVEIQPTELRRILLRARNAGFIEHEGEIVGKAVWPALVAEEKWLACKGVLEDEDRRTTTSNARVWLGAGIYLCYCGETAKGGTSGVGGSKKAKARLEARAVEARAAAGAEQAEEDEKEKTHKPAYRCRTGKHFTRDAFDLDEYIEGLAVDRLSRPDAITLLLPPAKKAEAAENLAATANTLRAKLDGITEDYNQDLITRKQMIDQTAFTRARLERITAQMAAAAATSVLASLPLGTPAIAELWPGYHLDKRRAILIALMTVTIHPARRGRPPGYKPGSGEGYFDDSTIEVQWKEPEERLSVVLPGE